MAVTYLMPARLPEGRLDAFGAYENAVLPLLAEHGGRLERRLRTPDDRVEAHLVSFAGEADSAASRADPRRSRAAAGSVRSVDRAPARARRAMTRGAACTPSCRGASGATASLRLGEER